MKSISLLIALTLFFTGCFAPQQKEDPLAECYRMTGFKKECCACKGSCSEISMKDLCLLNKSVELNDTSICDKIESYKCSCVQESCLCEKVPLNASCKLTRYSNGTRFDWADWYRKMR